MCSLVRAGAFGIAARSVQVVDELTKEDSHQREWDSCGGGRDCAHSKKKDVEPCWVGVDEKLEIDEEVRKELYVRVALSDMNWVSFSMMNDRYHTDISKLGL